MTMRSILSCSGSAIRAVALGSALAVTFGLVLPAAAVPAAAGQAAAASQPAAQRRAPAPYVAEWSRLAGHGGNATADLGPAAAGSPVSARVYLAGRDPRGLAAYATAVSYPGSPLFHRYLTPAQVRAWFGPDAWQVAAVRSWLAGSGLRVTAVTDHYVAVSGTAAQAQAAFGVTWHSYEVDGLTQQAPPPSTVPSAPANVAAAVLAVAPLETGLPGYPPVARARAATTGREVTPAQPLLRAMADTAQTQCSSYYGQNLATGLPSAYGYTAPYIGCGYTPAQLRSAYGVPGSLRGKGVTVAVVHPWRQSTAAQDLATFGARTGEPLRAGQFTQILPPGLDASCEGTTEGPFKLSNEETGDVELVHAMAPAADIVYVGARCDDGEATAQDLEALTTIVDRRLATIVSDSWASVAGDQWLSAGLVAAYEHVFQEGATEGIGFYFAAGDGGEDSGTVSAPSLIYPQSDPWVTSVGGTGLAIGAHRNYEWETGWGDRGAPLAADGTSWQNPPGTFVLGSGGGTSALFRQPRYQRGVVPASLSHAHGDAAPMRVVPDIAADADLATGSLVGETISPGVFVEAPGYGTSASTPLIAGMQADVQQRSGSAIGFADPAIYARYGTTAYHDVTDEPLGPGFTPAVVAPASDTGTVPYLITLGMDLGLAATRGYDDVTGVGSPAPAYFRH